METGAQQFSRKQEDRNRRAKTQTFSFQIISPDTIKVLSGNSGSEYQIKVRKVTMSCSCEDYKQTCAGTALKCKHVVAYQDWKQAQEDRADREFEEGLERASEYAAMQYAEDRAARYAEMRRFWD